MKYVLPAILFATPALAHPGAHVHPHGGDIWLIAALVLVAGTLLAVKLRK